MNSTDDEPVCIIATNYNEGLMFAGRLGLENYRIYTNREQATMLGRRFREVVTTPAYIDRATRAFYDSLSALGTAQREMERRGRWGAFPVKKLGNDI